MFEKKRWKSVYCTFDDEEEKLNSLSQDGWTILTVASLPRREKYDALIIASK